MLSEESINNGETILLKIDEKYKAVIPFKINLSRADLDKLHRLSKEGGWKDGAIGPFLRYIISQL